MREPDAEERLSDLAFKRLQQFRLNTPVFHVMRTERSEKGFQVLYQWCILLTVCFKLGALTVSMNLQAYSTDDQLSYSKSVRLGYSKLS